MLKRDFDEAYVAQYALQRETYGHDPYRMNDQQISDYISFNVLALVDELHEALGEVGWKNWASVKGIKDPELFRGELVDAFHFFMNLCIAAKMPPEMLLDRYFEKRRRNMERQTNGYTGTDKCPGCGRAWDDIDKAREDTAGRTRYDVDGRIFCSPFCGIEQDI